MKKIVSTLMLGAMMVGLPVMTAKADGEEGEAPHTKPKGDKDLGKAKPGKVKGKIREHKGAPATEKEGTTEFFECGEGCRCVRC